MNIIKYNFNYFLYVLIYSIHNTAPVKTRDLPGKSSLAAKILHNENHRRFLSNEGLSDAERQLICLHVMHGSTEDIVQTICSIGTLRNAVTNQLL